MDLSVALATEHEAAAIAALRTRAADALTAQYGHGSWSWGATERGVLRDIKTSRVLVARDGERMVGSLRLQTFKPWAIDPSYFAPVARPIYMVDVVVEPAVQRRGVGRFMLEQAADCARAWRGDAIRLDAYGTPAGAGGFYLKCGYREVGRVDYRGTPLVYFELLLI